MDVVVDGGVPALIDKETFDKVQVILDKKAQAPARSKALVDYMLSGKVICVIAINLQPERQVQVIPGVNIFIILVADGVDIMDAQKLRYEKNC